MATTIEVRENQSMQDVIVQGCGSVEAGMIFCRDNGVAISDVPVVGTVYVVSDAALAAGNAAELRYMAKNRVVVGNLSVPAPVPPPPDPLAMEIILYPVMKAVRFGAVAPATSGYWQYDLKNDTGFINVHALDSYGGTNEVGAIGQAAYLAGSPVVGTAALSVSPFPTINIRYRLAYVSADYELGLYPALQGVKFVDVEGNEASISPVVVMDDVNNTVELYLCPALLVEFVSTDGYTCTVRVTKSHAAVPGGLPGTDFDDVSTAFVPVWPVSIPVYPDPADALNLNKFFVDLPAGVHRFGVQANYRYAPGQYLPFSYVECVVQIS